MTTIVSNRELRQQKIVDYLAADPHTIKEIASELGMKYATAHADIRDLIHQGRIFSTGIPRNGAILYSSGAGSNQLTLIKMSRGVKIPAQDLLKSWAGGNFAPAPSQVQAMRSIFLAILAIYEKAQSARAGNPITREEFAEIRRTIASTVTELNDQLSYLRQLESAKIWTQEDLLLLEFDEELLNSIFSQYAAYVNAGASE